MRAPKSWGRKNLHGVGGPWSSISKFRSSFHWTHSPQSTCMLWRSWPRCGPCPYLRTWKGFAMRDFTSGVLEAEATSFLIGPIKSTPKRYLDLVLNGESGIERRHKWSLDLWRTDLITRQMAAKSRSSHRAAAKTVPRRNTADILSKFPRRVSLLRTGDRDRPRGTWGKYGRCLAQVTPAKYPDLCIFSSDAPFLHTKLGYGRS